MYVCQESRSDWLGDSKETLEGFHWRGGSERDTTGILLWSKPFIVKHPVTDEEVDKHSSGCLFVRIFLINRNANK